MSAIFIYIMVIFFSTKDTSIIFIEKYIRTDIIRYYLFLNSTSLKIFKQKYKYVAVGM